MHSLAGLLQDNCDLMVDDSDSDGDQTEDCVKLDISEEHAQRNYANAGMEVIEEAETITVQKYQHLMDSRVNGVLDDVVGKLGLPYRLVEFQRVAINALGQGLNVVLVSPTGSGKMNVALLATLVLRQVLDIPNGITIVTLPLSSIMVDKLVNDICDAAVMSMSGDMTTNSEDNDAILSVSIEDLLSGKYPVLFTHPEGLDTKLGQYLLRQLQKNGMLICICLDEFHQSTSGYWDSFR